MSRRQKTDAHPPTMRLLHGAHRWQGRGCMSTICYLRGARDHHPRRTPRERASNLLMHSQRAVDSNAASVFRHRDAAHYQISKKGSSRLESRWPLTSEHTSAGAPATSKFSTRLRRLPMEPRRTAIGKSGVGARGMKYEAHPLTLGTPHIDDIRARDASRGTPPHRSHLCRHQKH